MSIYKKLLEIQMELKVPKTHYNKFGDYYYRNCEDILDGVKPLLKKHGCTLVLQDDVLSLNNRYYVKATAILTDIETSETITTWANAREDETKPKFDGSQLTGSASSYARKYALNGLFDLDDVKDSDATNQGDKPENKPNKTQKITADQRKQLFAAANNNETLLKEVLKANKYNGTSDVNACDFDNIMTAIKLKSAS